MSTIIHRPMSYFIMSKCICIWRVRFSPFVWCKTESVLNLGENVTSEEMEQLHKWEKHSYLNNHNP